MAAKKKATAKKSAVNSKKGSKVAKTAEKEPQLEFIDVGMLIPYVNNAKTHSEAQVGQIAASITEFGFTNPVLIDSENGLIAGHGRLMAAQKLGIKRVPALRLGYLTELQKKAYILADNRLAEVGTDWDLELLSIELESLDVDGFDIELTGFDKDFIIKIDDENPNDPDYSPELPENAVTQLGDLWLMGDHRLFCGDSTLVDNVAALMDGQLADQLVTDPPYNVHYVGKTAESLKIKNDSMDDESFRQFLADAFSNADLHLKPGGVFYIWHADSEGYNFRGACRDAGWKVRQCLIWKKQTILMGRQDYHWKHEPCLYGWKDGSAHLWAADRKQSTILEFDLPTRSSEHPTMKPVELFEYQILNNTKGGDIVLDLFAGSGTSVISCEINGRLARCLEFDPKYCDVIVKRWQEFTGKKATLLSTGKTFDEVTEKRQ